MRDRSSLAHALTRPVLCLIITLAHTVLVTVPVAFAQPISCGETTAVDVYSNLQYGSYSVGGGQQDLALDLYVPAGSQESLPVLVFIHGGGWIEGTKDECPGMTFARCGYATACIDYRLADDDCSEDLIFPAQIHDVKSAVRWLRANAAIYGLDPNRFGALGDSSGAHLAALLGTSSGVAALEGTENLGESDAVQAVCDWYGPVDIRLGPVVFEEDPCTTTHQDLVDLYGGETTPYFYWTRVWGLFLGGSLVDTDVLDRAAEAAPTTYADATDPPFLIVHGLADGMVPIAQSAHLADVLVNAGVDVVFNRVEGMGHGYLDPSGEQVMPELLADTLGFFDTHLGGAGVGACTTSPTNLCLNQGRFRVEVRWRDFDDRTGSAQVVQYGSHDSGLFWFFSPDNWEMLVKVLDGCAVNDHFWVFSAATTNVEYEMLVTDTETGMVKEYFNPLGTSAPALTDTSAFSTCPSP